MTLEQRPESSQADMGKGLPFGIIEIPVGGINFKDVVDDKTGTVIKERNLEDPKIQQALERALSIPSLGGFVEGIISGTKMAFAESTYTHDHQKALKITVVTLTATLTAAVVFEFGARHGEDVTKVIDFFKPKEEQKPNA